VFRVVPTVFLALHKRGAEGKDQATRDAAISEGEIEASVALGFTAAIAALGLFFIPAMVAISIETTGTLRFALRFFIVFYATCLFITWWWYRREGAEARCD
jgi:NNP family nitrate/nitrite transporter-like MFS transporter